MIGDSVCWWALNGRKYACGFAMRNKKTGEDIRVTIKAAHIETAKNKALELHPGFKISKVVSQILENN